VTPTPVIYRIQAGENLFIIAERFGVPHDLLRDINGIENERALQVGQELIIPVGGYTEPIKPTPTPTPTPLAVDVENVYFHPSPLGELAILGEVYNTSSVDLEQVQVQITLFDSADRPLAGAAAFTALDVVAPGQRAPFAMRISDAPARFASYQAQVLSAVPAYLGSLYRDLESREVSMQQRPRQPLQLEGRILNVGPEEAVGVMVVVTTYDPLGRVVGTVNVVPEHNVVARGGETTFHVEIAPAGPVVTYTVQAQGRRLLPTPAGDS
jgi:LysM repeat protein